MKKFFLLTFVSLCSIILFAQDKIIYDANAEVRPVTSFHAVKISHGIELLLKQGDEEALAVSADEIKYRDAIKTEVVNGELRIYVEQNAKSWWKQLRSKERKMKAYVSFKTLDKIDGSSGSRTIIDGNLNTAILSIDISSGATIKGNLKSMHLTVDQSSGGKSYISGNVEKLDVSASSGAHFYGYDLTADKCNLLKPSNISFDFAKVPLLIFSSIRSSINGRSKTETCTFSFLFLNRRCSFCI